MMIQYSCYKNHLDIYERRNLVSKTHIPCLIMTINQKGNNFSTNRSPLSLQKINETRMLDRPDSKEKATSKESLSP